MFYWSGEEKSFRYINKIAFIESSMLVLNKVNISEKKLVDVINLLADFLQHNKEDENIIEFNEVVDCVVNIIEEFNKNGVFIEKNIENLKVKLNNLYKHLNINNNTRVFFYGRDKYNIFRKTFKVPIQDINNIEEYIKDVRKDNDGLVKILVLSEETTPTELDYKLYFDEIIYYDKVMNYLFELSEEIYYSNYDYYYLYHELESLKERDIDTVIVGNSYPLTGIKVDLLKRRTLNLSLSSQDLYYSFQLAKKAININKNIKRCIIGEGYYLVNHDLSKSQSEDAINRIKNVYYPLLKDKHNSERVEDIFIKTLDDILEENIVKFLFNLEYLDEYFKALIHRSNGTYFNANYNREINSMLRDRKLSTISEDDKWKLGEYRANQHNKLSKYTKTTDEYDAIFNKFIDFLNNNNVEPIIVIFPATKYYSSFLNKRYEEQFYRIINAIKKKTKIKIIDFSKKNMFIEEDFIDFDHMSEVGANKITMELNKLL